MAWIEIREPGSNKLLCKYDPARAILQFQRRQIKTIVELSQYQEGVAYEHTDIPMSGLQEANDRGGHGAVPSVHK